jgi:hypothetical protein
VEFAALPKLFVFFDSLQNVKVCQVVAHGRQRRRDDDRSDIHWISSPCQLAETVEAVATAQGTSAAIAIVAGATMAGILAVGK